MSLFSTKPGNVSRTAAHSLQNVSIVVKPFLTWPKLNPFGNLFDNGLLKTKGIASKKGLMISSRIEVFIIKYGARMKKCQGEFFLDNQWFIRFYNCNSFAPNLLASKNPEILILLHLFDNVEL